MKIYNFENFMFINFFFLLFKHPNVASNSEICVNTLKKEWKPELGIRHILLKVKSLLIDPNPESALNEEAGKLLLENYDEYFSKANFYTEIYARHNFSSSINLNVNQAGKASDDLTSENFVNSNSQMPSFSKLNFSN
jgi:ubiquitin-conjugating enzyme E2 S